MYGKHAVFAAINNPNRKIEQIYCLEKFFREHKAKLDKLNVQITTNDFIIKRIGQNQPHQGIIALVRSIFLRDLNSLDLSQNQDKIAILDQITDPQNIGTIIRSASAFGIHKIILPADNSPDENALMAKAASGNLELMQIAKVINLKSAIDTLKKKGFWIAGLDLNGTDDINKLSNFEKLAIIIGSEGKGMRRLILESCDLLVKIPISRQVESLNASAAASIVFYVTQNANNQNITKQ